MADAAPGPVFAHITEAPGHPATRAQHARMVDRYRIPHRLGTGRRVLEVACGTGIGLRWLARDAALAVGGDIDSTVLGIAHAQAPGQRLLRLDAQRLPFRDATFDLVCCGEAIYYLPDLATFIAEARRVLAPDGHLVITQVNPDRLDHLPSPNATRYWTAAELRALLSTWGFEVELLGSFPDPSGPRAVVFALARNVLARTGLVPKSLRAREFLKRVAYGALTPLPVTVEDDPAVPDPQPIPPGEDRTARRYYILHAIARKTDRGATAGR